MGKLTALIIPFGTCLLPMIVLRPANYIALDVEKMGVESCKTPMLFQLSGHNISSLKTQVVSILLQLNHHKIYEDS